MSFASVLVEEPEKAIPAIDVSNARKYRDLFAFICSPP